MTEYDEIISDLAAKFYGANEQGESVTIYHPTIKALVAAIDNALARQAAADTTPADPLIDIGGCAVRASEVRQIVQHSTEPNRTIYSMKGGERVDIAHLPYAEVLARLNGGAA